MRRGSCPRWERRAVGAGRRGLERGSGWRAPPGGWGSDKGGGVQGRAPRAARVGCSRPTPQPPPRPRLPTWALVPEAPPRLLLPGSVSSPAPPPPARPSRCRARAVPARRAPRSAPPSGPTPPAKVTATRRPAASTAPLGHPPGVPNPRPAPSPACVQPLPNSCPAHTGSCLPPGRSPGRGDAKGVGCVSSRAPSGSWRAQGHPDN